MDSLFYIPSIDYASFKRHSVDSISLRTLYQSFIPRTHSITCSLQALTRRERWDCNSIFYAPFKHPHPLVDSLSRNTIFLSSFEVLLREPGLLSNRLSASSFIAPPIDYNTLVKL